MNSTGGDLLRLFADAVDDGVVSFADVANWLARTPVVGDEDDVEVATDFVESARILRR